MCASRKTSVAQVALSSQRRYHACSGWSYASGVPNGGERPDPAFRRQFEPNPECRRRARSVRQRRAVSGSSSKQDGGVPDQARSRRTGGCGRGVKPPPGSGRGSPESCDAVSLASPPTTVHSDTGTYALRQEAQASQDRHAQAEEAASQEPPQEEGPLGSGPAPRRRPSCRPGRSTAWGGLVPC